MNELLFSLIMFMGGPHHDWIATAPMTLQQCNNLKAGILKEVEMSHPATWTHDPLPTPKIIKCIPVGE